MTTFAQIPTTGLIAYYPLGNTNYKDYSGNGYNADSSGCACTQEIGRNSLPNTSTRFGQGTTDAVLYNYSSNPTAFQNQTFTLSAWIYVEAAIPTNSYPAILTMGDNDIYLRFFNNAGVLNLQYGYRRAGGFVGGVVAVSQSNYLNTWKLVSLTRNTSGLLQLLVDGVAVSSTVNTTPIAYGTINRSLRIGNVATSDQQFEGRIQDVFYYNDAISLTPFLCSAVPPTSNTSVGNLSVCSGGSTTLSLANPNSLQVWYPTSVGGSPLATGGTYTTPNLTSNTTYWVEQAGNPGNCRSYARVPITVTVTPSTPPAAPVDVTQSFYLSRCGTLTTNLTVTASGTVNWYNQPTGGTSLGTGYTFTTPALPNAPGPGQTSTVTYYASNTNGCGTSARTPINITVNYQYSAQNTTPAANLNICSGTSTILTGTSNAPSVEWYLNQPPFTVLSTATSYTTPILTTNASYSFRAVDPSSNQCSFAVTVPVTVSNAPVLPVNTTPAADLTKCGGQTTTLTVSGSGTLEWFNVPTGGTVLGTGTSFTTPVLVNSTTPGVATTVTYYVQSTTGCGSSARVPIAITVKYQYTINNTTPTANLQVCQGSTTSLSITTNAPNIEWAENIGSINGPVLGTSATFTTPPIASGTSIFNAQVLGDPALTCSNGLNIFVTSVAAPAAPFDVTGSSVFCFGNAVQLDVIGSGTINWYNVPTGGTSLGTGGTFTTPVLYSNATYYAQATNGNCVSARTAIPLSILTPAPTNTTPTAALTICSGSSTTLTATGSGTLSWFDAPSGGSSLGNGTSFNTGAQTTNKTFYVQSISNNCGSARVPVAVTVVANPTAAISPATVAICNGSSATLTASGGTSFAWSNSGGSNAQASFSPTTNTTYTVTVTNAANCSATASKLVTVNAVPTAAISPATVAICNGASATLTASGGTTYAWSNSGGSNAVATVSPTTNTTYTVTVTNANNCSATASKLVTVNANPTATITPATATICEGTIATLTANGGTSYTWSNSGGSNAAATFSPTTNATYTVTVTNTANCSATASRLVTVNANPTAAISPATVAICNGSSATITASGGTQYAWSNSGGSNAAATFSPTTNTTYTVTVTAANTCTATASRLVTVNALPSAAINGPTSICSGLSATLTASGGGTYAWSNSLGSAAAVTVSPTTATTYTVTVTNNSCTATASQTVSVQSAPTAVINGASSVCAGSSITLTANGGNTYTWSNGGGTNASATFSPTTATTYTVTASLGAGCTASATKTITIKQPTSGSYSQTICFGQSVVFNGISRAQSGAYLDTLVNLAGCDSFLTLNLTVRPQITGSITQTVCFGGSTTFNGATLTQSGVFKDTLTSITGCDSILTLTFTVRPRIATSINQPICNGSAITFNGQTITTAGTYLDTLTSVNGCDSFITLNVTIAQATASTVNKSACGSFSFGGNTLTLSGTYLDTISNVAGCDSVITLNLTINQATASSVYDTICNGDSYSFGSQTINQGGTFNRTITNAAGCDSVITLHLFVRPAVAVTASASGFNLSATTGFVAYQWKLNGSAISGANAQNYTAVANGTYSVEVTDANGCKGISNALNVAGVGIENLSNISLTIYPNPATDVITIATDEQVTSVELFSAIGQKINVTTNAKQQINISDLAAGAYSLIIHTTNGNMQKRFVKE